ncbi:MAG TPA: hypothetical protein VM537_29510 [Anaerolineae bacterium]|nr:hypothetical protein [Anaerolineae bacterium]
MSEPKERVGNSHRAWDWVRARKLPLATLVATLLVLALSAWAGYGTTNQFTQNVLANLVADGLIALAVFIAANWALGNWQRGHQELDALGTARSLFVEELAANRTEVDRVLSALRGEGRPPEAVLMDGPPHIETRNWQLATDMPLASRLPRDVFAALVQSYNQCQMLASGDWYERAKKVYISSSERGLEELVADALPHFKTAVDSTDRALAMLGPAPQQK